MASSDGDDDKSKEKRWLPLESNPDVMNKYVRGLGFPSSWEYVDVFGMEEELLTMVPRPVRAVLLLFPISKAYEEAREQEEREINTKGQEVSANVWFTKQTIANACGTIAIVHSIANNTEHVPLEAGFLRRFMDQAGDMSPLHRADLLEHSEELEEAHMEMASDGQSCVPTVDDRVDLHFVCFVHKDGCLYELDGRKPYPINHGPSEEDRLLEHTVEIVRHFMARDPEELRFTMVALVPTTSAAI